MVRIRIRVRVSVNLNPTPTLTLTLAVRKIEFQASNSKTTSAAYHGFRFLHASQNCIAIMSIKEAATDSSLALSIPPAYDTIKLHTNDI